MIKKIKHIFNIIKYFLFKKNHPKFIITEGMLGTFHYHISNYNNKCISLCHRPVMGTNIKFNTWGIKSHLHELYCKECEMLYKKTKRV